MHGKLFYSKKRSGSKSSLKSVYSGTFRRLSPFPHSLLTLHTRRAEKGLEKRAERGSSFRSRRQEQDGTPDKLGNRNFISPLLASPPPFPPMLQGSKRRAGGRILCEQREGALNVCKRDLAKKRRRSEMEEFAKKSASWARRLLRHVQNPYFSLERNERFCFNILPTRVSKAVLYCTRSIRRWTISEICMSPLVPPPPLF